MIGIPTLFQRHPRTGKLQKDYVNLGGLMFHEWVATEMVPGVDVRVTVRNTWPVRLEVIQRPDEDQRRSEIRLPWYRDAIPEDDDKAPSKDYWLWKALSNTDFSNVPDGEWSGEAVGHNIVKNPWNLEKQTIILDSLYPWKDHIDGFLPLPPEIGRTPVSYEDLRYYLDTETSYYSDSAPMSGLIWWIHDTPVAQIRSADFPTATREPILNPGEIIMEAE